MDPKQRTELINRIEAVFEQRKAEKLGSQAQGRIYKLLEASECLLIKMYEHSVDEEKARGAASMYEPGSRGIAHTNCTGITCDTAGGHFEFGPVLYWLNNPPDSFRDVVLWVVKVLEWIEGGVALPKSKITPDLYQKIKDQISGPGILADDGSIYGENKYEQLDTGWLFSLLYFVYYLLAPWKKHGFTDNPQRIELQGRKDGEVSIALIGDWGTGKYGHAGGPAIDVINAVEKLKPDYIVHLGDVYYAGTEGWSQKSGEEYEHLIKLWPKDRFTPGDYQETSFTLNSNHEMYDGANGYFDVALDRAGTPFNLQGKTSFFALEFDPWVIAGFDSAYYSSPFNLFMDGTLGGAESQQVTWFQEHFGKRKGKNVIVLTHHNGVSPDGVERQTELWNDVCSAVGGSPDYWYWGHVHLGVVYNGDLPAADGVKARCAGHAAIPYGTAWGLHDVPHIDYFSKTKQGQGLRVRNGFAFITLHAKTDDREPWVEETFYEVADGSDEAVVMWHS